MMYDKDRAKGYSLDSSLLNEERVLDKSIDSVADSILKRYLYQERQESFANFEYLPLPEIVSKKRYTKPEEVPENLSRSEGILAKAARYIKEELFYLKPSLGKIDSTTGRPCRFNAFKLRTMSKDADKYHGQATSKGIDRHGRPLDDDRVTEFGKIARKYWLDEIPQFLNVLKGEMSLVGVRPMSEEHWENIFDDPELQKRALKFKPGLAGVQYTSKTKNIKKAIRQYIRKKEKYGSVVDIVYGARIALYILKGGRSR